MDRWRTAERTIAGCRGKVSASIHRALYARKSASIISCTNLQGISTYRSQSLDSFCLYLTRNPNHQQELRNQRLVASNQSDTHTTRAYSAPEAIVPNSSSLIELLKALLHGLGTSCELRAFLQPLWTLCRSSMGPQLRWRWPRRRLPGPCPSTGHCMRNI